MKLIPVMVTCCILAGCTTWYDPRIKDAEMRAAHIQNVLRDYNIQNR